jgi:hypothetical protein
MRLDPGSERSSDALQALRSEHLVPLLDAVPALEPEDAHDPCAVDATVPAKSPPITGPRSVGSYECIERGRALRPFLPIGAGWKQDGGSFEQRLEGIEDRVHFKARNGVRGHR